MLILYYSNIDFQNSYCLEQSSHRSQSLLTTEHYQERQLSRWHNITNTEGWSCCSVKSFNNITMHAFHKPVRKCNPCQIRQVTLLTKYATRKIPTWHMSHTQQTRLLVGPLPEELCSQSLHPELPKGWRYLSQAGRVIITLATDSESLHLGSPTTASWPFNPLMWWHDRSRD